MAQKQTRSKQIADNRAVRHSYFVLEDFEAGIALQGNEVKSIRQGNVNLKDSIAIAVKLHKILDVKK